MTPLFFVGNVRSGTSLMVRLLNRHPNIFVSHESDICWVLYQHGKYGCVKEKSFGGQRAIKYTVKHVGKYIEKDKTVKENYERVQVKLMRHGSKWLPPMRKNELKLIGDKSPVTLVMFPEFTEFVRVSFPDAVYIHMVRNPKDFVASMINRKKKFLGETPQEILASWVGIEKKVDEFRKTVPEKNVITIRYKDLGGDTNRTMKKFFGNAAIGLPHVEYNNKNQFVKVHKDFQLDLTDDAKWYIGRYGL